VAMAEVGGLGSGGGSLVNGGVQRFGNVTN
jgi:hypothetical protein